MTNRIKRSFSSEMSLTTQPDIHEKGKIEKLLGYEINSDDWVILNLRASDNLVQYSYMKWAKHMLEDMAKTAVGNPLLLDHAWYSVNKSIGFLINSYTLETNQNNEIKHKLGYEKINKGIIKEEKYISVMMQAAIPKTNENLRYIEAIDTGVFNGCSTGGEISKINFICPHCSKEHGRKVSFNERDENGNYVCPHFIPNDWYYYLFSDDEEMMNKIADYAEYDGIYENLELSLVNIGNLPNASILR